VIALLTSYFITLLSICNLDVMRIGKSLDKI